MAAGTRQPLFDARKKAHFRRRFSKSLSGNRGNFRYWFNHQIRHWRFSGLRYFRLNRLNFIDLRNSVWNIGSLGFRLAGFFKQIEKHSRVWSELKTERKNADAIVILQIQQSRYPTTSDPAVEKCLVQTCRKNNQPQTGQQQSIHRKKYRWRSI